MISMTFAAVTWDADDPCSVNTAQDPESSTISPRSTSRPLYFWCFASNSAFFQMTDVHQWTFDNHLDNCFVVLNHIQQSFLMRKLDVWGNTVNIIHNVEHSLRSLAWPVNLSQFTTGCPVLSWFWVMFPRTKTIRSHKSRAGIRPISIQRPKRWFRILLNCVKLKFVS